MFNNLRKLSNRKNDHEKHQTSPTESFLALYLGPQNL